MACAIGCDFKSWATCNNPGQANRHRRQSLPASTLHLFVHILWQAAKPVCLRQLCAAVVQLNGAMLQFLSVLDYYIHVRLHNIGPCLGALALRCCIPTAVSSRAALEQPGKQTPSD